MKDLFHVLKAGSREWSLAESIDPQRLPAHIAIIMDGNGRWARRRSLPRAAGHRAGVEPVRITVDTCARLGLQALTLYAFSTENWKRPRAEVDMLWRLLAHLPAQGAAGDSAQQHPVQLHGTHRSAARTRSARNWNPPSS